RPTHAPDCARIEQHLAEHHREYQQRHHREDTEQVNTPRRIESEEFQISCLEPKEEVDKDLHACKMWILARKVLADGEALDERSVRPEVASDKTRNLQLALTGVQRSEHQPTCENEIRADEHPIQPV